MSVLKEKSRPSIGLDYQVKNSGWRHEMTEATSYEIRVWDVLDEKWATYFAPFRLSVGENETLLTGVAHDQAELFGILLKIRDLGLQLISVNPIKNQR